MPRVPIWKRILYRMPLVAWGYRHVSNLTFQGSSGYWESRYAGGGHSGVGSQGRLAEFKANVLNEFVRQQAIASIIEFGCGDGQQLALADYPRYTGLDVSTTVLRHCIERFADDSTKSFFLYDPFCFQDNEHRFSAELALSIDVIYHLVEDEVYERYMTHLFTSATRHVIIYSSNAERHDTPAHVRHRCITDWISQHVRDFQLKDSIANAFPYDTRNPTETSPADFFFFERLNSGV